MQVLLGGPIRFPRASFTVIITNCNEPSLIPCICVATTLYLYPLSKVSFFGVVVKDNVPRVLDHVSVPVSICVRLQLKAFGSFFILYVSKRTYCEPAYYFVTDITVCLLLLLCFKNKPGHYSDI